MGAVVALTNSIDPTAEGAILTFISPSVGGCGLHCGYCFIKHRHEDAESEDLSPEDYEFFIRSAASRRKIAACTVQGYEPLAAGSLRWTEAILRAANEINAETGLVTNGQNLANSIELLRALRCGGVTVSIDSGVPAEHDKLRGRQGAWTNAMYGAAEAVKRLPETVISVHSILFPKRVDRLIALPEKLAEIGVRIWTITPLLRFDRRGYAGIHGNPKELVEDLHRLSNVAAEYGITTLADDELGLVPEFESADAALLPHLTVRTLSRPDGLLRLCPDGDCAFGIDVLRQRRDDSVRWTPDTDVSELLDSRIPRRGLALAS